MAFTSGKNLHRIFHNNRAKLTDQVVTLDFTSWIVYAMKSTLGNQRKKSNTQNRMLAG